MLENQLVQSEKLASLGQLAAGVAHEVNNPIGFVSSNLGALDDYFGRLQDMLKAYADAENTLVPNALGAELAKLRTEIELDYLLEDIPALIRESKDGISRVARIVKDLKDFSRVETSHDWQVSDLHQGIESTLNIVASELRHKADLVKDYSPLPPVECLPSQINQVIMNLLVNATQAMGASVAELPCEPVPVTSGYGSKSQTMVVAFLAKACKRSSIRSTRRSPSARAPGWDCHFRTESSSVMVARSA